MTAPTGTFQTFAAIGIREDLSDEIFDISPMERPFMSNVDRVTATAVLHEWQTDALASAANNATIEGDSATTDTASATTRFANNLQLSDKVFQVSSTQRAVNTAGRRDEYSYQATKRGRELLRDVETTLTGNVAGTAGAAGTARQCAGLSLWLWDNDTKTGSAQTTVTVTSGAPTTASTDGTAYTFTETHLKTMLQACWTDGGDANLILCGIWDKQIASGFSGQATQYKDNPQAGPGTIIGAHDVYVSDVGTHNIVASRFTDNNVVFGLDTEYWAVAYLQGVQYEPLAKTSHSDRGMVFCEFTLEARNPSSSGKVYATTTS